MATPVSTTLDYGNGRCQAGPPPARPADGPGSAPLTDASNAAPCCSTPPSSCSGPRAPRPRRCARCAPGPGSTRGTSTRASPISTSSSSRSTTDSWCSSPRRWSPRWTARPPTPSSQTRAAIERIVGFVDEDRRRGRVLYGEALDNEALNRRRVETGHALAEIVAQDAATRFGPPPPGRADRARWGPRSSSAASASSCIALARGAHRRSPASSWSTTPIALFTALGRDRGRDRRPTRGIIGRGPDRAPAGEHAMTEVDPLSPLTSSPLTSSPFVAAIEPITATDDEIARCARRRRGAAAPPRARVPHRRPLPAARRPAPRSAARRRAAAGWPHRGAARRRARALALECSSRFRDGGVRRGPAAVRRRPPAHHGAHGRRDRARGVPAPPLRGARASASATTGRPTGGAATSRPDRDFRVVVIGAGMSGILAAHRLQQAGVPFVVDREGRRRRRHLAGEHLSGLSRRQPEPQLQLLVRAAPRLAVPLLDPGRAPRATSATAPTRSASATTSASTPRSLAADVVRRRPPLDGRAPATLSGREDDARGRRGDQRGRPAQPAVVPRHRGHRLLRRRRRSTPPAGTTRSTSPASGSR